MKGGKHKEIKINFFWRALLFPAIFLSGFFIFPTIARADLNVEVLSEKTFSATAWCNCVHNTNLRFPFHISPETEYIVGHLQVQGFETFAPYLSDNSYPHSEFVNKRAWYFYFPATDIPTEGKDMEITFKFMRGSVLSYSFQIFGLNELNGELILDNTSYQSAIQDNISFSPSGSENNFFLWDIFNNPNYNPNIIESMENGNATPIGSWLSSTWQDRGKEPSYSHQKSFYSNQDLTQNFIASSTLGLHNNYVYRLSFTSSSTLERNPVILIPGLLGSWDAGSGYELDPILNTYDNLWEALENAGYEDNKTLFALPYDWRRSNSYTAVLLKDKIQDVLNSCEEDNPNDFDCNKVDLVAHSMGGLVARSYIEGDDYGDDVDQIVFIATPHKGAPLSYIAWEGGNTTEDITGFFLKRILDFGAIKNGYLTRFSYIRNFPIQSLQELLPIYDYLKDTDSNLEIYPNGYPINDFLNNLNQPLALEKLDSLKILNIVGSIDNDTINYIEVNEPSGEEKWEHGEPQNLEYGDGDGTVPNVSNENFYNSTEVFVNNSNHRQIVTDSQQDIIEELTGERPEEEVRKNIFSKFIIIRIFSPADFVITSPNGEKLGKDFFNNQNINEIEGAFYSGFDSDMEFAVIPNPLDGEYQIELQGTGYGEYRLSVSGIDDATSTDKDFVGQITMGQEQNFIIDYSSSSPSLLENLEPQDETPPSLTINFPLPGNEYKHSGKILIEYEAQDDFSGIDRIEIKIDDEIISTTTIDLFDYSLGTHALSITAFDLAGNFIGKETEFKIITDIDSTIEDINRIYSNGWLKGLFWKNALIGELKAFDIALNLIDKQKKAIEEQIDNINNNPKLKDKTREKLISALNKRLEKLDERRQKAIKLGLNIFEKTLDKAKKFNYLNQTGYDIIKSDIEYLKNNL